MQNITIASAVVLIDCNTLKVLQTNATAIAIFSNNCNTLIQSKVLQHLVQYIQNIAKRSQ